MALGGPETSERRKHLKVITSGNPGISAHTRRAGARSTEPVALELNPPVTGDF
jgi:hypothetical protein